MTTRNTVQQRIIAQQLRALGNHPTVEEVYRAVERELPSISKATVYRTLNKMVDAGNAMRVVVGSGAERFDHRAEHHSHVSCVVCGKVEDVCADAFSDGVDHEAAAAASGYQILGHDLVFAGVCPACRQS
ncbi:MAG TPA: transcriptional repressor [Eggerthellaceae bacterium]|nr:transcriptional repressor [Eggerthellaceae bacterium]